MIELKNIKKSFDDKAVIKGIDLKVGQGEVITFIGRSGSGKTTLLRMINALELPTEGLYTLTEKRIVIQIRNHK